MATVVDALIVTLGLDASQYEAERKKLSQTQAKLKDEAAQTGKGIEESGRRGAAGYEAMGTAALRFFGIIAGFVGLGSFERLINQTVQAEVSTGRLSKVLGQSTETLSIWEGALQRNQGAASDADAAFTKLADTLYQIQVKSEGGNAAIGVLQRLGINTSELKDSNKLLLDLAAASERFKGKEVEFRGLMHDLGLSDPMVAFLMKGGGGVQSELDRQRKIGFVTAEDAKSAAEFQASLAEINQSFTAMARTLINKINPALQAIAQSMGGEKNAIDWQNVPKWAGGGGGDPHWADGGGHGSIPSSASQSPAEDWFPTTGRGATRASTPSQGSGRSIEELAFAALIYGESRGQQFDARGSPTKSRAGAIGIGQVMPNTGPEAARLAGVKWDESRLRNDREYALTLSKAYFHMLYEKYGGDLSQSWAAYNAGTRTVGRAIAEAAKHQRVGHWGDYMGIFQSSSNARQTTDYLHRNFARLHAYQTGGRAAPNYNVTINVVSPSNDPHAVGRAAGNGVRAVLFNQAAR